MSRLIARTLSDPLYFAASSTLSDYETMETLPRHIQKIVTLSILYRIGFYVLLHAAGLPLGREGRAPMPDEVISRSAPAPDTRFPVLNTCDPEQTTGYFAALVKDWEELPLFLRFGLDQVTGIKRCSLSDLFWIARHQPATHPLLANGAVAVVNRRATRPHVSGFHAAREAPLCVLLARDGTYSCVRCMLDDDILSIYVDAEGRQRRQLRNRVDAEVVGQVTAIARLLA